MFDFTPEERGVILFISFVVLLGLGVSFLSKRYVQVKKAVYASQQIARIDINRANKDTLMLIPGVGEKLAGRIIEYRQDYGAFSDIGQLKNIKGINKRNYIKIEDSVFIDIK